jgi:hypothetical protein
VIEFQFPSLLARSRRIFAIFFWEGKPRYFALKEIGRKGLLILECQMIEFPEVCAANYYITREIDD